MHLVLAQARFRLKDRPCIQFNGKARKNLPKHFSSEKTVTVDLLEGGSYSTLKVIGGQGRNLLTVDYFKNSREMFLLIEGKPNCFYSMQVIQNHAGFTIFVFDQLDKNSETVNKKIFNLEKNTDRYFSGEQFDAKDEKSKAKEGEKFKELLEDPDFE